ncbi:MAG: AAA family ATPase [Candidatus Uhrbacteria bacterium]
MSETAIGIIGHEKILAFFEKVLANGNLAQAYLFVGPEMVGKTTVVEWLAKKILGPAGLSHPDALVLNRLTDEKTGKIKSEIVVDQVRGLRERLAMTGLVGGRKVAFIEEAEALNIEAANALLKTLEEPTLGTVLILRTSSLDKILPTIISRCQIIRFSLMPNEKIVQALAHRGIIKKDALAVAGLASGCPGYALRLLYDEEARTLEEVSAARLIEVLQAPLASRLARAAEWLPKDETNKAQQLKELLNRWEWLLRDLLLASCGIKELAARFVAYPVLETEMKKKNSEHWLAALEKLQLIKNDLVFHVNPGLALEQLLLIL